jgi:transcriptional regulator with XRE-family HTH domain
MNSRLAIKDAIKKYGTSVNEVAERMGITRITLSTHINGNPSVEVLLRIADAIGCDITELFASHTEGNQIICPKCGARFELKE